MPTKTELKTPQDILCYEAWADYTREVVTFRHAVGSTTSFEPGLVTEITSAKHGPVAVAANSAGVLLQRITDLATATDLANVLILKRGPAIVNEDQLNVNGLVLASCVAALAALTPPILTKKQPVKTTTYA